MQRFAYCIAGLTLALFVVALIAQTGHSTETPLAPDPPPPVEDRQSEAGRLIPITPETGKMDVAPVPYE